MRSVIKSNLYGSLFVVLPKNYTKSWFQTSTVFCMSLCFYLGDSPASECYLRTFRNTDCCTFI